MDKNYNKNYLDILYKIVDKELINKSEAEIEEIKSVINKLISKEKMFEFNENRILIRQFLNSLIRG